MMPRPFPLSSLARCLLALGLVSACGRGAGTSSATASATSLASAAPVGVRHSCLVGSDGRRTTCHELHGDASDEQVVEAKATCDGQEGQLAQSANPCPSDFVTRCVRRELRETRYGYDRGQLDKERALCGGDTFTAR
jgi:hypothetical protein